MDFKDLQPHEQRHWKKLKTLEDQAAYMAWLKRTRYAGNGVQLPEARRGPMEVGLYLTSFGPGYEMYSWWDGSRWMYTTKLPERAYEHRHKVSTSSQDRKWKKADHPSWAREVPKDSPAIEPGDRRYSVAEHAYQASKASPAEFFAARNSAARDEVDKAWRASMSLMQAARSYDPTLDGYNAAIARCVAGLQKIKGASPRRTARADPRLLLGEVR